MKIRVIGICCLAIGMILLSVSCSQDVLRYYVSPDGSDKNPGTLKAPFATLGKARDEVRANIAQGLSADVEVVLRKGTYTMHKTLVLGLEDSAPEGFSITYKGYEGEKVDLGGGYS